MLGKRLLRSRQQTQRRLHAKVAFAGRGGAPNTYLQCGVSWSCNDEAAKRSNINDSPPHAVQERHFPLPARNLAWIAS
eukprot:5915733-Pleurochrysis_carterae.AAC.3